jgi:hypothetical protein
MTEPPRATRPPHKQPTVPRAYRCRCGRPVFFGNTQCLACGTPLGYEPQQSRVLPLQPGPHGSEWQAFGAAGGAQAYRRCGNFDTPAGCNWLVPVQLQGATPTLCRACSLNRTIPDLSVPHNGVLWARIEAAKRRLVSQLIALGLPVRSKAEDARHGLAFDFLQPLAGAPVSTGHAGGVITLNIEEADDARREHIRAQLHEPYRTLLGHLRHEVGHYYWSLLVDGTPRLEDFRALFGDERQDYAAALQANYEHGPPPDWAHRHVTAYASSHPWEDWAETWAHYLHMVDTVDTALSFGIDADDVALSAEPWGPAALWQPEDPGAAAFLAFLNEWTELTAVLNEMSRSMGQPDFYPFVLPRPAVAKLQFIHLAVREAAGAPPAPIPGTAASGP